MNTRQRSQLRNRPGQRYGSRNVSQSATRPNFVSLLIALGVIGLLVVMFPLDWINKPSVVVAVDRSAFSPNDDGVQEEVAAFYTLSESADVEAIVYNSAGLAIRHLINDQPQPAGQHAITWNGRDDSGQKVTDGLYQVVVNASATARQSTHSVPVEVDTTPPSLQLANFPAEARTVREAELIIEGTTDPNVKVWLNNDPQPIAVDARGIFRLDRQLEEGENNLNIRAVDAAGNEALLSRQLTLRTQPPQLALLAPAENNSFVSNNLVSVRGTVPADVTVAVNGREADVNEEGNFFLDMVLEEGANTLKVVAVDPVGNESVIERQITLSSRGPTINLASISDGMNVYEPSVRVSGSIDPGAQLQVNGNTVPVDANGNFSTLVPLQGGNNLITATASDIAGNTTSTHKTVHYATTSSQPTIPEIAIPDLPTGPWFWRILVGVGLVGGALFMFGGLASPIAFEVTADYPVFYPNRPNDRQMLIMRMHMSRGAKIDIDVYDEYNRHIVTLMDNQKKGSGEHFRFWDGRNAIGQLLSNGSYLIQGTARTATNTVSSAVWVRLDASPSVIGTQNQAQTQDKNAQGHDRWVDEGQIIDVA